MRQKLVPRWVVLGLIAAALLLPVTVCVVLAVSSLLVAMNDIQGGVVTRYIAWGCGILWAISLVSLVLVQGLSALSDTSEPPQS